MADAPTCPRCGHHIPNDETPGAYPGARSRVDNKTEICSACGTDEAFQQMNGHLSPIEDWPIEPSADMRIYSRPQPNDGGGSW